MTGAIEPRGRVELVAKPAPTDQFAADLGAETEAEGQASRAKS